MKKLIVISFAVSFILAGCAGGMDSAECVTADWKAIGFEDGANGRAANAIAPRRKACAEHGVTPDFEAYMAGRDRGLVQYCRPQNGFRLGNRGVQYSGVCPIAQEAAFQAAHSDGYGLYQRRVTVSQVAKKLRNRKHRANKIEQELVRSTAELIGTSISLSKQVAIGVKVKQLAGEKYEVDRDIERLQYEYGVAKQEFEEYRVRVALRRGG